MPLSRFFLRATHLILTYPGAGGLFRGRILVAPGIAEVVRTFPLAIVVVVEVFGPVSLVDWHSGVVLMG